MERKLNRSFLRSGLFHNRVFLAGCAVLTFYIIVALSAPLLYPGQGLALMNYDHQMEANCTLPSPPTLSLTPFSLGRHPLGETYFLGLGVAQGLIAGTPWDLMLISAVLLSAASIGVLVGLYSGVSGGRTDWWLMTVVDAFLAIPDFVLLVFLGTVLIRVDSHSSAVPIFVSAMVITLWAPFARGVRAEALRVTPMYFVQAAVASGAGKIRIAFRHVLPNSLAPVFSQIPISVAVILMIFVGLQFSAAFFNYGLAASAGSCGAEFGPLPFSAPIVPNPRYPEWGGILAAGLVDGAAWIPQPGAPLGVAWWGYLIPGVWILFFGLGIVMFTDGLYSHFSTFQRRLRG